MTLSLFSRFNFLQVSLLLLLMWLGISTSYAGTVVIVNPSVKTKEISPQSLGRIYAMQIKNWSDGQPVKVFTFPSNSKFHHQFVITQMKLQPHLLERLWNRLIFTGTGRTPTVVNNSQEMIQKVKETPGAIGYVTDSDVSSDVNVLVIGK
ncbi:hypothetical protein JCM30760_20990 [Thiomicrorhabdus hydrogeniphila]